MGIEAKATGRNDVLIDGRKVSGNAFYHIPGKSIVHGTMLYDTQMEHMVGSITPSDTKLVSKGVRSVRQHIALLKDSSLVSIITLVDLTRTYGQLATVNYDYFGTGFIVAVIYLIIGTPFVKLARRLEKKLNVSLRGRRVVTVHRAANYNE